MVALFVPLDGRLTSQNVLSGPLTGGEIQEIVSPGNAALGNTYQVSLEVLAAFYAAFPALNTELILAGATSISPYAIALTDTRILFNKTLASASFAVAPLASTMLYPGGVLLKDLKGDADVNNITVTFTGGELCDGQPSVVINSPYGWATINPTPGGGSWYQS